MTTLLADVHEAQAIRISSVGATEIVGAILSSKMSVHLGSALRELARLVQVYKVPFSERLALSDFSGAMDGNTGLGKLYLQSLSYAPYKTLCSAK